MISYTKTLIDMALTLIKCTDDAFDDVENSDFKLCKEINTAYGVAAVVSINIHYTFPFNDSKSSISISVDNASVFEISFKHNERCDDDWKLDAFKNNSDKNLLLLNVASEALASLMMDMVHEYSTRDPSLQPKTK